VTQMHKDGHDIGSAMTVRGLSTYIQKQPSRSGARVTSRHVAGFSLVKGPVQLCTRLEGVTSVTSTALHHTN
jgi:hypothetical protein